jgi:hypothetical protein
MWTHKTKYPGKEFLGNYELQKDGTVNFHLICGKRTIKYRSYHVAKKNGWSKS